MLWHKYNYLSIVWGLSELTVSCTDSCHSGHCFCRESFWKSTTFNINTKWTISRYSRIFYNIAIILYYTYNKVHSNYYFKICVCISVVFFSAWLITLKNPSESIRRHLCIHNITDWFWIDHHGCNFNLAWQECNRDKVRQHWWSRNHTAKKQQIKKHDTNVMIAWCLYDKHKIWQNMTVYWLHFLHDTPPSERIGNICAVIKFAMLDIVILEIYIMISYYNCHS